MKPATIDVSSALAGVEFTVTDGAFRPVAQGMGRLKTQLPAGIYELSTRAGGRVETLLVSLEPGQVWSKHDISMEVFSAAPLSRGRSALPGHAEAAWIASRHVAEGSGPPAGLVVQVRVVDANPAAAPGALHHGQLRLLDTSLEPVPAWSDGWRVDAEAGVATNALRLPPGGYVLRQQPSSGPSLDQTVWLPADWQTLIFCPDTAERVLVDDASVHLTRLDHPFEPDDYAAGAAAELAIAALRQGLPLVSADLPRTLEGRPANPILGIVGAHTLLLEQDPDLAQFYWVVQALLKLLPDHPDVIALANHPVMDRTILPSLHWPPMLAASYEVLLQADRTRPRVIADGSPAERVAGYVVQRSPWLRWEATPAVLAPEPDATREIKLLSATTAGATRRVQAHLHELVALTGESPEQAAMALGDAELARRLDLPIQTVRVVLRELGWTSVQAVADVAAPVTVEDPFDDEYRRLLEQELVPSGPATAPGQTVDPIDRGRPTVPDRPARWRWVLIAAAVLAAVIGGTAAVVNLAGDSPIVDPTATPTATVAGPPTDLRVTIHGDTRARAGRRITPYVQVLNQGQAVADATLVVTVPAAFEVAGPVDGCTADGRRLTCAIAPAAATRTRTDVQLIARGGPPGRLTAEVRNKAGDPDPSDDRASVTLTVTGRTTTPTTAPTKQPTDPTETPTVTPEPTPLPTTPLPTTPGTS